MRSVEQARILAEAEAKVLLECILGSTTETVLTPDYVDIPNGYIFYRRPDIKVPPEKALWCDKAFVVPKRETNPVITYCPDWRGNAKEAEAHALISYIIERKLGDPPCPTGGGK